MGALLAGWGMLSGCNCLGPWQSDPSLYDLSYQAEGSSLILLVDTELAAASVVEDNEYEFSLEGEPSFTAALAGLTTRDVDCDINENDGERRIHCAIDFSDVDFVKERICGGLEDSETELFIHALFEYELNGEEGPGLLGGEGPGYFVTPGLGIRGIGQTGESVDICLEGLCAEVVCAIEGQELNPDTCGCTCPSGEMVVGDACVDIHHVECMNPAGCAVCPEEGCDFDPNDSDGDGVIFDLDNCPGTANRDQEDSDDDGLGDACDRCPNIHRDASCSDADGDLFAVSAVGCPSGTTPTTAMDLSCDIGRGAGGSTCALTPGLAGNASALLWPLFLLAGLFAFRFKRKSVLMLVPLGLLLGGCFLPDRAEDYEVNYYSWGSDKHRVYFYFTAVPFLASLEESASVNGEPVSSLYEVSEELNYEVEDHRGLVYTETKCFYLNDGGPGKNLCWLELNTGQLQTLLCSEEGWVKIKIPSTNVVTGVGVTNITDSSAEIPASQIEPAEGQEELDECSLVEEPEDSDGGGGEPECGVGEELVDGVCVPEEVELDCDPGMVLDEDGMCVAEEIPCDPPCADGFRCDLAVGECVEEEPEEGRCTDASVCGPLQYCNNETGACEDFDFRMPTEGTGSGTEIDNQDNDNNEPQPEGVNCAFNPSQCSNTKGWCQLNPSAPFNPFVFISLLGLPLMAWFRRTV